MDIDTEIRRKFIEGQVEHYQNANPEEFTEFCKYVVKLRDEAKNKWREVESDDMTMAHALEIPKKLFDSIEEVLQNPKFLQEEAEKKWFMWKYPFFIPRHGKGTINPDIKK